MHKLAIMNIGKPVSFLVVISVRKSVIRSTRSLVNDLVWYSVWVLMRPLLWRSVFRSVKNNVENEYR